MKSMATCTVLEECKNSDGRKECNISPDTWKAHLDTDKDSQIAVKKLKTNPAILSQP